MAGNKIDLQKKLEASTILEVVIAMVLIVLVFGTAMMMYTNVVNSSLSVKKIRAQSILVATMLKAEQTGANSNQTYTIDDFRIEQEIKLYNSNARLYDIHLTAYDLNQQKIAELEKVTLNNNE